jgi:uncharacterized protein
VNAANTTWYCERQQPWINEFHYDNFGTDVKEFIEVAAPADLDVSSFRIILYNGFAGYMYSENAMHPLSDFTVGETVNGVTFYTQFLPPANCSSASLWCGFENGRDGIALANYFTPTSGRVIEFISYEGSFTAKDGPATNMTSTDIGVMQRTTTPLGYSISRSGIGCKPEFFGWQVADTLGTPGTVNAEQTITCQVVFINEFDVTGGAGQFIEVAANVPDISSYSVVLYSGQDGLPYDALVLDSFTVGTIDDGLIFYFYEFPATVAPELTAQAEKATLVILSPETTAVGMALVKNDDTVLEFLSYGGNFTAQGGVAVNMTSTDVGVKETPDTPAGSSVALTGTGCAATNFAWTLVESFNVDTAPVEGASRGVANVNQDIVCELAIPTMAPTTAAQAAALEDDLVAEDDDFLDDQTLDTAPVDVSRIAPIIYIEGTGEPKPVN